MSYYTSSTLLDYYGGAGSSSSSSSRYDSILGLSNAYSAASSSNYGSSAIDRYYSYLDDVTSAPTRSTSYYSSDLYSMPNRYSSSSRYDSSGYSSLRSSATNSYASEYSSRYSRPMISRAPTYDKYGKELSNYDRWRMQHGDTTSSVSDTLNNNHSSHYNNNSSDVSRSRRRISRIEDESSMGSSGSVLTTTSRELSVMPGASVSSYENDLAALPSRFANMGSAASSSSSVASSSNRRGKSLAPSSSSSGYSSSFGGKSYGSSSGSSSASSSGSFKIVHSFPLSVSSKLAGYQVRDVKGDGGCYYRCLSVYFTGSEDNYNKYRREVVGYIRENMDNYSSMIRSEVGYASTSDYFSRKMRTDHQEFAETTEIIATCCLYNINVHVLALVPGKRTWEWLHFDPSIGSGRPSTASRDIYLYNQGSVHFMLCTPK